MARANTDLQVATDIQTISSRPAKAMKRKQPNVATVKVLAKEQRLAAALQRNLLRRKQQE